MRVIYPKPGADAAAAAHIASDGSADHGYAPLASAAMAASDIDASAGAVQTRTISGATTFTASNFLPGVDVLLILTNSGAQSEPTWPTTTTSKGSTAWDGADAAVNRVVLAMETTAPTYLRVIV